MKILQSYPLVYETLLKIHWFYKMKSQQIRKRNYQMNIIFQKERENKFTLLEAMSFQVRYSGTERLRAEMAWHCTGIPNFWQIR